VTNTRSRHKQATALALRSAAVRLMADRGYEATSTDEIARAAGVSPRTFFNYFPTKESAVVHAPQAITDDLAAEFIAKGKARHPVVVTDLIGLLVEHIGEQHPSRRDFEGINAVAREHPTVLAAMLSTFEDFTEQIADIVARRLGMLADEEVPQMIAGLAIITVRTGMDQWSKATPTGPDTPVPYVERAARLLRTFFGSDDARRPVTRRKRPTKAAPRR
jgi:AcrR family transcriptional regulator